MYCLVLFKENEHRVLKERSKDRRDNFIYTWAGPERGRSPESHRPESLVQRRDAGIHFCASVSTATSLPLILKCCFLQYVVSCIIENRNAFSDSLFIYSVVFHYHIRLPQQTISDLELKKKLSQILNFNLIQR